MCLKLALPLSWRAMAGHQHSRTKRSNVRGYYVWIWTNITIFFADSVWHDSPAKHLKNYKNSQNSATFTPFWNTAIFRQRIFSVVTRCRIVRSFKRPLFNGQNGELCILPKWPTFWIRVIKLVRLVDVTVKIGTVSILLKYCPIFVRTTTRRLFRCLHCYVSC